MANLNLTAGELLALHDILRLHYKSEGNVASSESLTKADPTWCIIQKVKSLLVLAIESLEDEFEDTSVQRQKFVEWAKQETRRIEELKRQQHELRKEVKSISLKYNPGRDRESVGACEKLVQNDDHDSVKFDDLTRELNEEENVNYPKKQAPRPVMPQQGRFKGRHKK